MTRRAWGGGALAVVAIVALTGCSANAVPPPSPTDVAAGSASTTPTTPASSDAVTITLAGPLAPVPRSDDPVLLVVEITGNDGPLVGAEVTFLVIGGPGEYPGGFEVATTDEHGIATSNSLQAAGSGVIEIEVATDAVSSRVQVEIDG